MIDKYIKLDFSNESQILQISNIFNMSVPIIINNELSMVRTIYDFT
jgi:hypothetical protein